jgi:hypothetical protein
VVVVTAEFEAHGRRIAAHHGHPSLPMIVLPYPLEGRPDEEVRSIAAHAYGDVLVALGAVG